MSMGNIICDNRKRLGLTQDALAQKLGVTNQAVSKWETDQSLPDVTLLPQIADVFGITIDALFGRMPAAKEVISVKQGKGVELPWEDDEAFHVVLFCGHTLIGDSPVKEQVHFCYEGPAKDVCSDFSVECEDVQGNVTAGTYVECGTVGGAVNAGTYVECGDVAANIGAGGYVECGTVGGAVNAGTYVECGDVAGNISAGGYVECGNVGERVGAGSYVECGDVSGNVSAGGNVECGNVEGKVSCFGYSQHEYTGKADFSGGGKSSAKYAKDISDRINNEIMNDLMSDIFSDMFGEKKHEE